ncbi:hypothetical protein Tco_1255775 [Tanacetum coccineum]
MEKLEDENVSLDFIVQSLIKERDNVKLEYQKLFNSIKKTRSQTQTKMDELIAHVSEKTYAYGAIRAENQNLLVNIYELKTRLESESVGYHVVSKPVTLQTLPAKQSGVNSNKNVIAPGMKFRPEKIVCPLPSFLQLSLMMMISKSELSRKEIVARSSNECHCVGFTEPDYKNLNKNDIEDMYLLIMNGKVPDYAETGLLWSLSVFIRSSVLWEWSAWISYIEGVIQQKNSKKEKKVMRHSEIHKFCDATLNKVLEGLRSYNNDVKYGYIQRDLTNEEVEYLKLFEEEIEVHCFATGASLGLVVLSVFAMLADCASRDVVTLSATSFLMAA